MICPALIKFFDFHYQNNPHTPEDRSGLRLGQRFYIMYIRGPSWPELFYANDEEAGHLIAVWLERHQYYNELPQEFKPHNLHNETEE